LNPPSIKNQRIYDEVNSSMERVPSESRAPDRDEDKNVEGKLTSSKIAQKLGLNTAHFLDRAT
jgi:hypothetical protein